MSGIQNIQVGSECPIEAQLADGAVDQYPQAKVYNENSSLLITINLSHRHLGNYNGVSYSMPNTEYIKVAYTVYSDAGHTVENTGYERVMDIFYRLVAGDFKATGFATENPPSQNLADYKAVGFAVPNEYDGALLAIQNEVNGLDGEAMRGTDGANTLPPPDISALALEATTQEARGYAKVVANHRWKMVNNQMIYYEEDGVTPLYTFDLKDAHGNPAMKDVFDRVPL